MRPTFTAREPGRLFIGGEWATPAGDVTLDVIYPATGEVVAAVAGASVADVERAVSLAREAFDHGPWPRLPMAERAAGLTRIAQAMRARLPEFAQAISLEMGSPLATTTASSTAQPRLLDYYAGLATELPEIEPRPRLGGRAYVVHEPIGVVAAIVPWNAPLSLSVLKLAPALAAGCTIILKSAPSTPLDAILLAECIAEVGLPQGVVSILPGGNEAGDALVRDARVDKVTFTGSTGVGRHIAAIAGERIGRVALELGGKSPAILLVDMEPEEAARLLFPSATMQCGQACSALTRVLVSEARHDRFVEAFAALLQAARLGDPFDDATTLGPLALERQRDRVESYIATGRREGAKLVTGGGRPAHFDRGFYVEPTLFTRVENGMTIAREEIFGPVISVLAYRDEEDAIRIANDSSYGLYGAVFTHDEDAYWRIARRLRAGNVGLNGVFIDRMLPYGGFKQSGLGREGGVEGLRSFQELKTLYLP